MMQTLHARPRPPGRSRLPRAILATLLALGGCSDLFPPEYEYAKVAVQATRANGEPVPGVELILYTGQRHMAYGRTGDDGTFLFANVPYGHYGVGAVAPRGYDFSWHAPRSYSEDVRVDQGDSAFVSFTFIKYGTGTVEVRTVDESGAPVPRAELTLYTFLGAVSSGTTGPDGRYRFDPVPTGRYGVRVNPLNGYIAHTDYVDGLDVEDGTRHSVTLRMERCEGRLRVRTVDAAGAPLGGVPVVLYTFRGTVQTGVTSAEGVFEFLGLSCGLNYGVRVEPQPGLELDGGPAHVDDIDPQRQPETSVSFTLRRCFGRIAVGVADRESRPVPGARLTLYTFRGTVSEGVADAEGRFVFAEVPCGEYGVRVAPPAGYVATPGRGGEYLDAIEVEHRGERSVRFVLDAG